ncbi:50S ribosomal protein L29 [Xanthovirga aplysinae]|uniref:50S ribosomal protein L29 n=1 Tax=Xanthovirga aplysinae TaxID=2529853 RepID=UPI0012BD7718|nr:50S ribosomal protein L29 [Xanthovirga aplysinae]MTI32924.1 50S ribosomal protein L29 [Xanthovirga aplysinae]
MENSEIKALSLEELRERVAAERESLQKLKFAHAVSPIENPMKIKTSKRLVARLETEIRAKELNK